MAYLRGLPQPKCRCGAVAKVALYNDRNACNGEYCRGCGRRELNAMKRREHEQSKATAGNGGL